MYETMELMDICLSTSLYIYIDKTTQIILSLPFIKNITNCYGEIKEMANGTQNPEILHCKLSNDKRFNDIELDLQKVKDDVDNIIKSDLKTMEARLNKQAQMVGDIQQLSFNVASLSQNMKSMLDEIKAQNDRLNNLEKKPLKRWDNILDTIIKLAVTAVIGIIFVKIGLQ